MKRKPFVMQGFCLWMILYGMHSCFFHVFLPAGSLRKFMAALLVAALWFTALTAAPFQRLEQKVKGKLKSLPVKHPVADLLLILTVVLLAVYLLTHLERIQQDAELLSDAIIYRYDKYYGNVSRHFLPRRYPVNGSRLLFSVELLLAFLMAKAFSCRNGMFLGTLPVAGLVSGCLLLGLSPSMWDMAFMVCGVLGMQMVTDGIRLGGRKGFRQRTTGGRQYQKGYPVAAILLAVVFLASGALSANTADTYMQKEDDLLEIQHKVERRVVDASVRAIQKIMMMLGIDQPGIMSNVSPSYTGETVLTITTDKKPETDLYLRGFIGTKYEDGRWTNPTPEGLQSLNRYLLLTQDYDAMGAPKIMSTEDDPLLSSGLPSDMLMHMTITYAGRNRTGFGYLPYYSRLTNESEKEFRLDGDYGLRRDSSVRQYKVNVIQMSSGMGNTVLSTNMVLREGGPELDLEGQGELKAYCDYVLKNDTWLPDKGLERTERLVKKLLEEICPQGDETQDVLSDPMYIIGSLRHFFWTTTSYSRDLHLKASRQDYVENFLFQQKKGYCEHYATAGAVMFRAMGIPSRYVSGYKVSANDFKSNEDGTYTARVLDSSAHAWTEIYTYPGGWMAADMTPSDDREDTNPSRDANELLDPTKSPDDDEFLEDIKESSKEEPEEVTPTPIVTDQPEETDGNGEKKQPGDSVTPPDQGASSGGSGGAGQDAASVIPWVLAVVLFIVLALLWNLQPWCRHRRLKRCGSHRSVILEMNRLLERYLRCCGYRGVSRLSDEEYIALLRTFYPAAGETDVLGQYYTVLEKSRFAEDGGSREEVRWCKRLLNSLGRHAVRQRSLPRRFYVRWVRNWRR